ncbi:division/cell wall cluster transcriptional repressor MraZ [Candidatus Microgenomates bacterium]|nr:division/cell wall cluster transcriptional repressor MraZ [Candidatus Microgenomates bacterium]
MVKIVETGLFLGEYSHSLTGGNRLALPKKIRSEISGDEVILARGFESYIAGFDRKKWEKLAEKQLELPLYEEKGRLLRRQMFAGAMVSSIDSQGRVVLPSGLKDFAGIEEKVVIIGAGDHFEIWESEKWQEYSKKI